MKKILLAVFLLAGATAFAQTTTWKNDKMHSKLTFTVTHLMISDIDGLFKNFDVTITTSKADFSDAVFELKAEVASINTEVEMRDNDLKSDHFFDAAKYPYITFKSTSIKSHGKDKYTLYGDLTMHGVTKPVSMELWYRGTITNPMSKKQHAGFKLTGEINRLDFGVGTQYPAAAISDKISIKADGEFSPAE
jgi:polyisoprenoid-binding protein YceI